MSKLTIIIPMMKPCPYLTECMDSLAQQNTRMMDVLIVRDFEDEECQKEIEELKKTYATKFPVEQVYLEDESGLSGLRNYALMNCQGEYVMFMEPEDTLAEGTIKELLDAVPNLPVPLVYCRVKPKHRLVSGYHEEYEEEVVHLFETDSAKLEKRPAIDQTEANYEKDAISYMVELRDHLEDFTVLGCMFHKSFLKENDILFSDSIHFYPDAPFISKVLMNASNTLSIKEGAYIRRNGTFRYEIEKGRGIKERMKDYMNCYDQAYSMCISNPGMMLLIQETMCTRYVNMVIRLIAKSKDQAFVDAIYQTYHDQMNRVDKRVIASFSALERKHLKLLKKGDEKASIAYMKTYIRKKKREYFFRKKAVFLRTIADRLFGNMDVLERYILFESGHGQRYYSDPKYIYRYLQKNYPGEYRCIWVANNKELADRIEGHRITVRQNSLRYFYYVLRAKYWIRDTRQPIWWYKAPEQRFIATWLGTPMQKWFLDKQAFLDGEPALRRGLKAQVDQWDYVISANDYTSECLKSGLGVRSSQILRIGQPRNDLFFEKDCETQKKQLKEEMGLPADKKTILYAPVWREEEATDVGDMYKMQLGLHRMKETLSEDYVVLIRIHDHITGKMILDKALEGFVYDFSFYDDVQELMLVSDMMITDYSSMIFDYACLKRPIYFYWYDREIFEKNLDQFYYSFEEASLPGPVCSTTQEIINYIKETDHGMEQFSEAREEFYQSYCSVNGHASETLARKCFQEMHDLFEYEDEKNLNLQSDHSVI